jgi:hypothetical protein
MRRNMKLSDVASPRTFAWPLELDAELCASGGCRVTAEKLQALSALLNEVEGVSEVTAKARARTNLVRVFLTVDAEDPHDAHDRVCALVRECVSRAGLGPAILVATRPRAMKPVTGRRMG